MGLVIRLADRAPARPPAAEAHVVFHFDLGCPFSYLAAEQVERSFGDVAWHPVAFDEVLPARQGARGERWRAAAERRAAELRLALSWPERLPVRTRQAHRVASLADELGAGSRFALAAARLVFCGGFELDEPGVLLEAAAAAGLALERVLQAAGDCERDRALAANAAELREAGITRLPAISIDGRWYAGEQDLVHAALQLRVRAC